MPFLGHKNKRIQGLVFCAVSPMVSSMFFSHAASFFAWLCLDVRQDPDWKMNSLLVGQPGHLRGHAVGGTLKFGGEALKESGSSGDLEGSTMNPCKMTLDLDC